jgi:hypothetical protein
MSTTIWELRPLAPFKLSSKIDVFVSKWVKIFNFSCINQQIVVGISMHCCPFIFKTLGQKYVYFVFMNEKFQQIQTDRALPTTVFPNCLLNFRVNFPTFFVWNKNRFKWKNLFIYSSYFSFLFADWDIHKNWNSFFRACLRCRITSCEFYMK